jgi:integrase
MAKDSRKLTDAYINSVYDFAEGEARELWDSDVRGLRLRIGKHRCTWTFFQQHRRRGHRSTTCRKLGYWLPIPNEGMSVRDARKAALRIAGRAAEGRIEPTAKEALLFTTAFDDYLAHLLHKVESANDAARKAYEKASKKDPTVPPPVLKEPLWHRVVTNLGKLYLRPQWQGHTLAEISASPEEVMEWHRKVSKDAGPVTGNKVAKVLRATYRYAKRLRRDLPPDLPTSAVTMNDEEPREAGMTDKQHRKWAEAWQAIENPSRKAYHLLACLTGQRPGELARLRVADIDFAEHRFTIKKAKASNNIVVPISGPIEAALKMAIKARNGSEAEWLFPAREGGHIRRFDSDGLPCWGNGLRHNYKTISSTMTPPVDEMLRDVLQGHTPKGVPRKYVSKIVLAESAALHKAQERISKRVVGLLDIDPR